MSYIKSQLEKNVKPVLLQTVQKVKIHAKCKVQKFQSMQNTACMEMYTMGYYKAHLWVLIVTHEDTLNGLFFIATEYVEEQVSTCSHFTKLKP